MSEIKPPKFLADLIHDLKERHLLIPAIALIVAALAVPTLLKKSSEPAATPVPPNVEQASAVEPAVLADDQVNVRDYRKRLDNLKSKNPFAQQFVPVGTATDTSGTTDATATTDSGATTGTAAGATDSSLSFGSGTTGDAVSSQPPSSNGGSDDNEPSQRDVDVVHQLFTYRVNVRMGVLGSAELMKNVKPMTVLPDESTPVAAFLGADQHGTRAAFVLSSGVANVTGDGACVPSPTACLYVTLEEGESMTFDYTPDAETYELKLRSIHDVKVKSD